MKTLNLLLILLLSACTQATTRTDVSRQSNLSSLVSAYQERQSTATPEKVMEWLIDGNDKFSRGIAIHGGYLSDASDRVGATAGGQRPLAVVLSCIDSRTSPEIIFDMTIGDLFTVRVGANVINDDILGSLEIAVESGAKVLVVIGHTDCGGVKGACRNLQLGHMTQLLDRVKPAILDTNKYLDMNPTLSEQIGERVVGNKRYIAEVSHMNARQSARQILERSTLLNEKVKNKEIILVSGIYDVNTGKVTFDNRL